MGGGWEQDGGGGKEHGDSGNKGGWDGGKGHKDGYGKDHHFGGGKDHDGEENKGKGFKGDKGGFKGKKGDYDGGYKGGKKGGLTSSNYGVRGGFARRKAFDINAGVVKFLENWNLDSGKKTSLFPTLAAHPSAARDLVLPHLMSKQDHLRGGAGICTRQVVVCYNKSKTAANALAWNPTGRRLCVGNHNGEVSLWNTSQGCNFEIVQQSHTASIRLVKYAFSGQLDEVLFTGDQAGVLKLWDKNFCNTVRLTPHDNVSMRDVAVGPALEKFTTCADEPTVKIWDFRTLKAERTLLGHGYDVRALDWHPSKALVATGSKDNQLKLYDPRMEAAIVTLYHHKNSIAKIKFQPSGMCLASGGKDQLVHVLDIRTMRIKNLLKGHAREVTSLCWHPKYDNYLASAGFDNCIYHWDLYKASAYKEDGTMICQPEQVIRSCHEGGTTCLDFHPLGTVLASSGRDGNIKLWSRAKPGHNISEEQFQEVKAATAGTLSERLLMQQSSHHKGWGKKGQMKGAHNWSEHDIHMLQLSEQASAKLQNSIRSAHAGVATDEVLLSRDVIAELPAVQRQLVKQEQLKRARAHGLATEDGFSNPFSAGLAVEEEEEKENQHQHLAGGSSEREHQGSASGALIPKAGSISTAAGVKAEANPEGLEMGEDGDEQGGDDVGTTAKDNNAAGGGEQGAPKSSPHGSPRGSPGSFGYLAKPEKRLFPTLEGDEATPYRGLKVVNGSRAAVPLLRSMGIFAEARIHELETDDPFDRQMTGKEGSGGGDLVSSKPGRSTNHSEKPFIEKIKRNQEQFSRKRDYAAAFPTFEELRNCLRKKGKR